jgi:outer membrane protein OmpA-like peptidoglycan-associated protein
MKILVTSSRRARVGCLFGALFAVLALPNFVNAQIALPISPTNRNDPRVLHNNPAIIRAAIPTAYLGLKLIYPGVSANNAFALKTSLFNLATSNFASSGIGAAAHGHYFTTPLYSESRFGVTGARSLGERMHVGLDFSLQTRRYAVENFEGIDRNDPVFQNGASASAFDPSVGVLYQLNDVLEIGASVLHFTRPNLALGKTAYRQPMETLLGIGFTQRFARFDAGAHYWQNRFRPLFGAEIFDDQIGRLRLGFALNNAMLEGQLALKSNAALFYNFSLPTSDLGLVTAGSHEFGVAYVFHPRKIEEEDGDYISLRATPDSLALRPGEAAPFALRFASAEDLRQVMDLKLTGAPPGLRVRPQQIKLSSHDETIISLQSEKSLPPGAYEVLLEGKSRTKRGEASLHLKVLAAPKLFARVAASVDTVTITESREVREELPLIPRVFFTANSDKLAQTRYDLISSAQRDNFFQDVREINSAYRNLLNIIAERLRVKSQAVVTIRGFSSGAPRENDPEALALRRSQYVRDYLLHLGVNASRIQIEPGKPELAEARNHDPLRLEELQRVDLEVAPEFEEEIFAPIQSEKKEIDAIPAQCRFVVSDLSPGTGLAQWQLRLIAEGDTIKTFSAPQYELAGPLTWELQSEQQRLANFWQEVRYSLSLRDSWGQEYRTPERTISSRHVQAQPKQIEKIPLILFAFDDYQLDQTSRRLRTKLVQIAAKLKADPLAQCELLGFTDAIGDSTHNLQLSQRRGQNVLSELVRMGIAPARLRAKGFGMLGALANNNLPEGRMLNRRVEVHIRHARQRSTK